MKRARASKRQRATRSPRRCDFSLAHSPPLATRCPSSLPPIAAITRLITKKTAAAAEGEARLRAHIFALALSTTRKQTAEREKAAANKRRRSLAIHSTCCIQAANRKHLKTPKTQRGFANRIWTKTNNEKSALTIFDPKSAKNARVCGVEMRTFV